VKIWRNLSIMIICVILGFTIAWQYKSVNYNQKLMMRENKRADQLKDELILLQRQNNDLRTRIDELKKLNDELQSSRTGSDQAAQALKKSMEEARIFAGLTDVRGKGVIVTVDNGNAAYVLEDDILDIVNELRAAGAQAISVNDERIVAMTEIREAGNYIMINQTKKRAPFVIKAIGDPDVLDSSLKIPNGVVDSLKTLGLSIQVSKSNNIQIPKIREEVIKIDLIKPVQ